jgi:CRISPR-associated protein Cmr5
MDKRMVERYLVDAEQALIDAEIAKNGKINKSFRGKISSFGAAVTTGSLLAAVAFFNEQRGAKTEQHKLMVAINKMLDNNNLGQGNNLFEKVKNTAQGSPKRRKLKEHILACAVALKLAMNLFELEEEKNQQDDAKQEEVSA